MPRRALPSSLKLLSIAILAVLPVLSAYAGPQSAPTRSRNQPEEGQQERGNSRSTSSLSDAIRRVERDTRGEVLSAERVQYDGRDMHRVKVVDDEGRVRIFMQDPNRRDDTITGFNRIESQRNNEGGEGLDGRGSNRRKRPTRGNDD